MKRSLDIFLALSGLILWLPSGAILVVLILLVDRHRPFFVQTRVGRRGRPFRLFKLRTMRRGEGSFVTTADDSRVTALGRFLRRWHLDEWPQLFNILLGDMSLVGPRPEVPQHVNLKDPLQWEVLQVRPGLVDPAVLLFLDEAKELSGQQDVDDYYRRNIQPRKLALSASYLKDATALGDVALLLRAFVHVFRHNMGEHGDS